MIVKKRQLVTAALVLVLGAAVFVNRYYTKSGAQVAPVQGSVTQVAENLGDAQYVMSDTSGQTDAFAEARLRREKAQSQAKETLENTIKDAASTEAAVKDASAALAALTKRMTLEADMETLIGAKTGMENLVILGEDSVEVLLTAVPTDNTAMLQITDIAATKTGLPTEKITIMETK